MKKQIKRKKKLNHKIQSSYLEEVYTSKLFSKLVPATIKVVKQFRKKHPFDAIAFCGSSGAALAFIVSYNLKIPLIHVRKKDGNHFDKAIEGSISSKRYLILDDTIATGYTVDNIMKTINREYKHNTRPVGICLYAHDQGFKYKGLPVIPVQFERY